MFSPGLVAIEHDRFGWKGVNSFSKGLDSSVSRVRVSQGHGLFSVARICQPIVAAGRAPRGAKGHVSFLKKKGSFPEFSDASPPDGVKCTCIKDGYLTCDTFSCALYLIACTRNYDPLAAVYYVPLRILAPAISLSFEDRLKMLDPWFLEWAGNIYKQRRCKINTGTVFSSRGTNDLNHLYRHLGSKYFLKANIDQLF